MALIAQKPANAIPAINFRIAFLPAVSGASSHEVVEASFDMRAMLSPPWSATSAWQLRRAQTRMLAGREEIYLFRLRQNFVVQRPFRAKSSNQEKHHFPMNAIFAALIG